MHGILRITATVETTEAMRSAKNATKSKETKPAETEFFAGVDEPNDDKDNRVAEQQEELLNSRKEQLEALQGLSQWKCSSFGQKLHF